MDFYSFKRFSWTDVLRSNSLFQRFFQVVFAFLFIDSFVDFLLNNFLGFSFEYYLKDFFLWSCIILFVRKSAKEYSKENPWIIFEPKSPLREKKTRALKLFFNAFSETLGNSSVIKNSRQLIFCIVPHNHIWKKITVRIFERKPPKEYSKANPRKNIRKLSRIFFRIFFWGISFKYSFADFLSNIFSRILFRIFFRGFSWKQWKL